MASLQDAIKALGSCLSGSEAARVLREHATAGRAIAQPGWAGSMSSIQTAAALETFAAIRKAEDLATKLASKGSVVICRGDATGAAKNDEFNSIIYAMAGIYANVETLQGTVKIVQAARSEALDVAKEQAGTFLEPIKALGEGAVSLIDKVLRFLPALVGLLPIILLGVAAFFILQTVKSGKGAA